MKKALTWYTDVSKTLKGTGVRWVRPKARFHLNLGKLATVFLAETIALPECEKARKGNTTYILTRTQQSCSTALASLNWSSKTVWDYQEALKIQVRTNKIIINFCAKAQRQKRNKRADGYTNAAGNWTLFSLQSSCGVS